MVIDVDNQSVAGAHNRGQTKNREIHALLVQLLEFQVEYGCVLFVEVNPERGERGRGCHLAAVTRSHHPCSAGTVQSGLGGEGLFNVDLMASTVSVLRSRLNGEALPFFSQYACAGSAGTNVLAHDVSIVSGTRIPIPAFGFCFSLAIMAGHILCNIWRNAGHMRSS